MKISESIVQGILSGGSKAPPGSPLHRSWNHHWSRFFKNCADHLLGWMVRNFPNLSHEDAEDVIGPALKKTYDSLKDNFDPEQDKIESWIFTNIRRIGLDLLRKKGRSPTNKGISLDSTVGDEEGLQLHEILGAEDAGFNAFEEGEVQNLRIDQISEILKELEAQGKCSRHKLEIYKATQAGEKPADIALRLGEKRSYVDSTKNEIKGRLMFIAQRMAQGVSLEEAVAQSAAKSKPAKNT